MIRYLLFVNLYGGLIYLLYQLFLKNRDSHLMSRFFLLTGTLLALFLPLIQFSLGSPGKWVEHTAPGIFLTGLPTIEVRPGEASIWSVKTWVSVTYFLISGLLLIRLLYGHLMMFYKMRHFSPPIRQGGISIFKNTNLGPGSYMQNIFFPGKSLNQDILRHEKAHILLGHNYDQIFFQLILALFFPVIPFYFIRRESAIVREFQADKAAVRDKAQYLQTLIKGYGLPLSSNFIQSFFQHPLKRRIMMLSKSRKSVRVTALATAGIFGFGLLLAFQNVKSAPNPMLPPTPTAISTPPLIQSAPSPEQIPQNQNSDSIYRSVDKHAEFPGGDASLMQWLSKNITYPDVSKEDRQRGTVMVQFVVDESGKTKDFRILKDLTPAYDSAAIQALRLMPVWKPAENNHHPVTSYFILPIQFAK